MEIDKDHIHFFPFPFQQLMYWSIPRKSQYFFYFPLTHPLPQHFLDRL